MARDSLETLVRPDGARRIQVEKRSDGYFSFSIDKLDYAYDEYLRKQLGNFEKCWHSIELGGIYIDREAAIQEAFSSPHWTGET